MADTLFVTGRLAEPALCGVVSGLEIDHQIVVMNISVAALMTTRWIAKRLQTPDGVDNIVVPGLCEGDVDTLQQATGLPVRKGPAISARFRSGIAAKRSAPSSALATCRCSRRSTTCNRSPASR